MGTRGLAMAAALMLLLKPLCDVARGEAQVLAELISARRPPSEAPVVDGLNRNTEVLGELRDTKQGLQAQLRRIHTEKVRGSRRMCPR